MQFKTIVQEELNSQLYLQELYSSKLVSLPDGTLWTKRRKDGNQYYIKLPDEHARYLDKKQNSHLISQLQRKQFFTSNLSKLNRNIPLLTKISEKYTPLSPANIPDNFTFTESENPAYPEALIHNTSFGLKVRSKSEAMIADALYMFEVPQLYERKLILKERTSGKLYEIFPDFTIPLPDGRYIYWEHKGRMDDPKYRQRNLWKESLYFDNGIYPPHNLIITMDGPHQEFDLQEIHRVIKGMILPRLGKL